MPPSSIVSSGHVNDEEMAFYHENGFVVYRGLFTAAEVDILRADADVYQRMANAGEVPDEHLDKVAPVTRDNLGQPMIRHRLNYFTRYAPHARSVLVDQRVLTLSRELGGPGHWLLEDTMNGVIYQLKTGGRSAYSAIRWHFDFPVGHMLSPALTVGVYLDRSTRSNGCLAVIPKSHRNPVGVVPPEPYYVEVEPGDVVCHHERIFHGSGPAQSMTDQRATIYMYFCGGEYPGPNLPYARDEDLRTIRQLFVGGAKDA